MKLKDNKMLKILQIKKTNLKNLQEILQVELKGYGIHLLKNDYDILINKINEERI